MDKAIRQTQQELGQFLKQQHRSLDELFTYFPNQIFAEMTSIPPHWDSFYREDLDLDYLPDPQEPFEMASNFSTSCSAWQLSKLLKKGVSPFVFYLLIRAVFPLARGLYRYREKEHALEFLSEPSAKLLEKIPILESSVPFSMLVTLPRSLAEPLFGQRYLVPALLQLGQHLEQYSQEIEVKPCYSFDGNEILKRLEIPDPVIVIFEMGTVAP